jgi:hypothetical protein
MLPAYTIGIKSMDAHLAAIAFVLIIALFVIFNDSSRIAARKTLRSLLYDNCLARSLRNKFLQLFAPGVSAIYFLCLDVWGDDWDIIKNNKSTHETIFFFLIFTSLLMLLFRGIADWYEDKSNKGYISFLEQFSILTSKVVNKKLSRFKEKAQNLKPTGDTFKQITQPKDQINLILGEIESLMQNHFGIKARNLCISILHKDPGNNKWYFIFETQKSWKHTRPERLMSETSAANDCLETGEHVFHPCKESAAKVGKYFLSDRDKSNGGGSVFCYPSTTKTPDYTDNYVISIVTYGKLLCDPLDSKQSQAVSEIFCDLSQRLDLELTLQSMKMWRGNKSKRSQQQRSNK